jgi:hypothetical protein
VVKLRKYDGVCGGPGEAFVPMAVDALLGNPEVALRQVGKSDPVIQWAPAAKDLFGRGQGTYLDLPGDSLKPGCIFSSDSARYTPLTDSAVYAHVVQQADRPELLAVQYWLFWYYNDWNDKHEGEDGLRESSFVVPGGSAAAQAIIETFCSVVGQGSVLFINSSRPPPGCSPDWSSWHCCWRSCCTAPRGGRCRRGRWWHDVAPGR